MTWMALLVAWCASAGAQEPPPVTFSFDSLLVATVQAQPRELQPRADEVQASLQAKIAETVVVIDMGEAPRFTEQDIDARTYMLSCPQSQYAGCALVVGQRVKAEYAVGGTLTPTGATSNEQMFTVHFVDVEASEEVVSFGVVVGNEREEEALTGVAALFDKIVKGAFDVDDVRGDIDDPESRARVAEARERLIAASLDELEESLGELIREEVGIVQAPKLTREDLVELRETDDLTPWQRMDMSEREYLRFSNSGYPLPEWKRRARGRFGQVLVGVGFGGGTGPYTLHHEGRYLKSVDETTDAFYVSQVAQYQELRSGTQAYFQGEVMIGVAPILEVGAFFGARNSPISFLFDQDREGDPSLLGNESNGSFSTAHYGVRAGVIPLTIPSIRPTLHGGIGFWKGVAIPPQFDVFERLEAPNVVTLQVLPGVEMSAGRWVNLYARGFADIPIGGTYTYTFSEGPDARVSEPLKDLTGPEGSPGIGFGVQAGFQVRFTLLPDKRRHGGPVDYDDDEELYQ